MQSLSTEGLEDAFDGEALDVLKAEIERRAASGEALTISVAHDVTVQVLDPNTARVDDRYVVDGADTGTVHDTYELKRLGDVWKVVYTTRQQT